MSCFSFFSFVVVSFDGYKHLLFLKSVATCSCPLSLLLSFYLYSFTLFEIRSSKVSCIDRQSRIVLHQAESKSLKIKFKEVYFKSFCCMVEFFRSISWEWISWCECLPQDFGQRRLLHPSVQSPLKPSMHLIASRGTSCAQLETSYST